MAENPQEPPAIDPDNVPETLCLGKFNITPMGSLAAITFTQIRAKTGPLLDDGKLEWESVVRARIVTSAENLAALRGLLNRILESSGQPTEAAGGGGRLN